MRTGKAVYSELAIGRHWDIIVFGRDPESVKGVGKLHCRWKWKASNRPWWEGLVGASRDWSQQHTWFSLVGLRPPDCPRDCGQSSVLIRCLAIVHVSIQPLRANDTETRVLSGPSEPTHERPWHLPVLSCSPSLLSVQTCNFTSTFQSPRQS